MDHAPLLEVLTRRYYGNKALADVRTRQVAGCPFVVAEHPQADVRVVTTAVAFTELPAALRGAGELAADRDVAADIYLAWDNQPEDPDAMAAELGGILATADLPGHVRRVTTTVAGRSGAAMHHHFTFRPSPAGFTEERLIRGLHPLIAQRMQLERLRNFDLTRLPSSDEEVYLFRCVAPENPADERLVALAQLRDLTPLREHDGRLVALPAAEDILATCLDSIRRAQARRPATKRFNTNRILIYVWPPSDLTDEEVNMIAQRVLPTTAGAGLEEVLFLAKQRSRRTGELTDVAVRITYDVTPACGCRSANRRPRRSSRSTTTGRRCCARPCATPSTRMS